MKIVNRFLYDGVNNGYTIDDDGLEYGVTELGLYDQSILEGLIAEGYKVIGYYGNIITPSGVSIRDLEVVPFTASEDERQIMIDMQDSALSEAEASAYFTRDIKVQTLDFLPSTNEIKTREELITYLRNWNEQSSAVSGERDVRPLNSFVSREALFTIEEYITDPIVKQWFSIIEKRRTLRSQSEVRQLVKYLQLAAGLKENPNADDVKQAYLAWGLCGFSSSFTDVRTEFGVLANIYNRGFEVAAENASVGRVPELCPMDEDGNIYYSNGVINFTRGAEMNENAEVVPTKIDQYEDAIRSSYNWPTKYSVIKCWVKSPNTRTFINVLDDNGSMYKLKVDNGTVVMHSSYELVYSTSYLTYVLPDGFAVKLDMALNETGLLNYVLARAKARDLVKARTVKTPVSDSFNLCINEGVSPYNAINYMARCVDENKGLNSGRFQGNVKYYDAAEMYRTGPTKDLIAKYNPDEQEYNTIDELIDIMLNTRDELDSTNEYLPIPDPGDVSPAAEQIRRELATHPLEQLEFAKDAINGLLAIDNLGSGIQADAGQSIHEYALLLTLIAKLESDSDFVDTNTMKRILSGIETKGLFDYETVFPERSAAFRGYLSDRATLNYKRAKQSALAAYVTRVYREAANVSQGEGERHYAFEAITLDLKDKRAADIANYIERAIVDAIDKSTLPIGIKDIAKKEAASAALHIMFGLRLGKIAKTVDGDDFIINKEVEVSYNETALLSIRISNVVVMSIMSLQAFKMNQIVTLYDWCELEMTNYAWNLYCLNACITPWMVTPKHGVTLPTYNFAVNYIRREILSKLSAGFQEGVAKTKAKVTVLKDTYRDNNIMEFNLTAGGVSYTVDNIDMVLHSLEDETMSDYYDRFDLHNREASKANPPKYLKRMRLKADVEYANYGIAFSPVEMDEEVDEYVVRENPKQSTLWITNYEPVLLSDNKSNLLTVSGNAVEKFDLGDESFADVCTWTELLTGDFKQYGVCAIIGSDLLIATQNGTVRRNLNLMKVSEFEKLVSKNIIYQLGARKFYIRTTSGDYKVEVVNN